MYLPSFQQVVADGTVKTASALTIPPKVTHAELQATEQPIFYTMDNTTDPTTGASGAGMVLLTTQPPKQFLIEDIKRIRFTRAAGTDGKLNVHYLGGRDI